MTDEHPRPQGGLNALETAHAAEVIEINTNLPSRWLQSATIGDCSWVGQHLPYEPASFSTVKNSRPSQPNWPSSRRQPCGRQRQHIVLNDQPTLAHRV